MSDRQIPANPSEQAFASSAAPSEPRGGGARRDRGAGRTILVGILGGIVGAAVVVGAFAAFGFPGGLGRSAVTNVTPAATTAAHPDLQIDQPVEGVAATVVPSVVNVAITQNSPFGGVVSGNGSGIVLTADGYILTNNHVVQGAASIIVRLGARNETARVVGTDPASDLAVIKVAATGLPAASIGNSANLVVGQVVIAVGSPFGLDKTVTEGIVSALHRSNLGTGAAAYTNLIQTDAAINPGNSGGGLFDINGRLIGVNTLIESPSGQLGAPQSGGIGFAIPIDYAKFIADQIIAGKKVQHPYLGVGSATVDSVLAAQVHLSVTSGALIQQVASGSPAEAAGIKVGDIIVSMGGQSIATSDDLLAAVRNFHIGQKVPVELVRKSTRMTVEVTIGSR
jgi:putative serine protease PepD